MSTDNVMGVVVGFLIIVVAGTVIRFHKWLGDLNYRQNRQLESILRIKIFTWGGPRIAQLSYLTVGVGWIAVGLLIIALSVRSMFR